MPTKRRGALASARRRKLEEAMQALRELGFGAKQSNETASYALLALLGLQPAEPWSSSVNPPRGITPIINFVSEFYALRYAPNSREQIRDEAVKHFAEAGLLIKNPDNPSRPTTSAKTVYQVEPHALELLRTFGSLEWQATLKVYLKSREAVLKELARERNMVRIPVTLPSGKTVTLSPGGQNPLIKEVIEEFCPRFVPGGLVVYIGDAENKFLHLDSEYLKKLGIQIPAAAKMPDIVVHYKRRNWLLLIEAVTSVGPVDGKRRSELKQLFSGCKAGLIFVTAFATRGAMRSFLTQISWETEVWVAENPDHLVHFNGERFLGPYPDVLPPKPSR
jgi:hypothetical protein